MLPLSLGLGEGGEQNAPLGRAVIGGPGAFVIAARDYTDFADAILKKLVREITPIPEPGILALLGIGLGAMTFVRRRV